MPLSARQLKRLKTSARVNYVRVQKLRLSLETSAELPVRTERKLWSKLLDLERAYMELGDFLTETNVR